MKCIFKCLGFIMLCVGLAGCGGGDAQEQAEVRVALALSNLRNPFFQELRDGALAEAAKQGVALTVLDAGDDPARQSEQIAALAKRRVAVILLNPVGAQAVTAAVRQAVAGGVKVVSLDRSLHGEPLSSHIESDNIAGGMLVGQYLMSRLGARGRIAELTGTAGSSVAHDRDAGLRQALSGHADAALLTRRGADFDRGKGQREMASLLRQYPDIRAVFAQNDEMALGAVAALRHAGRRNVAVVGFDAIPEAVAAVKAGELAATVRQQPGLMGRYGIQAAKRLAAGQGVDTYIAVPLKLITQADH
ncbi:substrate-binding domain-containing protein [Chromobacterium paludis]|nr:substrate-binding domain-containing protein [Chromobacterium paludis]